MSKGNTHDGAPNALPNADSCSLIGIFLSNLYYLCHGHANEKSIFSENSERIKGTFYVIFLPFRQT